jgi:hypothetical protein
VSNGELMFAGADTSGLFGLWESDGTAAGTHELTGITGAFTGPMGLNPQYVTSLPNGAGPTWAQIDNGKPMAMAGGDFEGLGSAQLVASETGAGTWIYRPSVGSWNRIDTGASTIMAEGNLYGTSRGNNNQADVAAFYPGQGTWTWQFGFGWNKIDSSTPTALTAGDFFGTGVSEVVGAFGGVWMWAASTGWKPLDGRTATLLTTGNFYGTTNGNSNQTDLAAFFPGFGTYVWAASFGWSFIDNSTPSAFAAGNFLGTANGNNNQADLAAFFPGQGTWIWSEANGWSKIDSGTVSGLAAVDLNGDGQSELLAEVPGSSMWEYQNGVGWQRHDNTSALPATSQPPVFATGNFLGGSDILPAVGFQNTSGIWLDPPTTMADTVNASSSGAVTDEGSPNVALVGQAMAAFAPPGAPDGTALNALDPTTDQTNSLSPTLVHGSGV